MANSHGVPQPPKWLATRSGSCIFQDFSSGIRRRSLRCQRAAGVPVTRRTLATRNLDLPPLAETGVPGPKRGRFTGLATLTVRPRRSALAESPSLTSMTHPFRACLPGVYPLMQQVVGAARKWLRPAGGILFPGREELCSPQTRAAMPRLPIKYILNPTLRTTSQPLPSPQCHCSGLL